MSVSRRVVSAVCRLGWAAGSAGGFLVPAGVCLPAASGSLFHRVYPEGSACLLAGRFGGGGAVALSEFR